MTSRAPSVARERLPFGRRVALTLIAQALVPLVLFGVFSVARIDAALGADLDARVRAALGAAQTVLAEREQELIDSASAYATWPVTRQLIDDGEWPSIERDILDFQVERGPVDLAMVVMADRTLAAGPPDVLADLTGTVERTAQPATTVMALGGDLYQLVVLPVSPPPPADPTDAGGTGRPDAALVVGRRLDAGFAHSVQQLSGFDVALIHHDGTVAVASDPQAVAAFRSGLASPSGMARQAGFAAGWIPIGPEATSQAGMLVSTRLDSVGTLLGQLPAILLVTLGIAALLSVTAAFILGRALSQRLASVHSGLADMAVGRRPAIRPSGTPELARLEHALEDLVQATDRRDLVLRQVAAHVAGIHAEEGVAEVGRIAVEGARAIFGFERAALVRSDGTMSIEAGVATPDGRRIEVPLEMTPSEVDWLVGDLPPGRGWTLSDDALFGLYARLIGSVLRDARVHDDVRGRLGRLGRLNQLQREFVRSVSHNLQTPLTTISLLAEDLADPRVAADVGSRADRVGAIRTETTRLERLVSQLLTVSRLDAGRVQLESDPVAVGPVVRRVWDGFGADRAFTFEDEAPEHIALADRGAMEQILYILLDNALRYAPDGPIRVRAIGVGETEDRQLRIEVIDAGPGVTAADRPHIFKRFWSGAVSRQRGGTGIGLDIARRLARAMDATVAYRPGDVGGSVFSLTLPAEVARPD